MNDRVLGLFKTIMAQPEGPTGKQHKRLLHEYVGKMSDAQKEDIMAKAESIDESSREVFMLRKETLLGLGFTEAETNIFARCRLSSPGLRKIMTERVEITKHATDEEIDRINAGSGGTLLGLITLYGRKKEDA